MLSGNFAEMTISTPFRDLLHAANLRHGTDGFTSPPKEGGLRIFSPLKIRRLRPGLNPQTWVLKASTLPLDHRSQVWFMYCNIKSYSMQRRILWVFIFVLHFKKRCVDVWRTSNEFLKSICTIFLQNCEIITIFKIVLFWYPCFSLQQWC